ncbi:MAG: hypothetical protein KF782_10495 [Labilithrix sp.]|nr:hypothetical protein [Labilithrix sp.]
MSAKATPAPIQKDDRDPVAAAIAQAPSGPPTTEEERAKIAEARASRARGERTYSGDEITALIEKWRQLDRPPTDDEVRALLQERQARERNE